MKPTAGNLKHVQFWPHCARQNGSDLITMQGCKSGPTFVVFKTTCFTNQLFVCLFFHRHPSGRRMFPGQPWYHPTAQLHQGFLRKAVGDLVTPFVLERLFDYSCSVEFAGSYYGHVPCKFRKVCLGLKYLPQINYGGN